MPPDSSNGYSSAARFVQAVALENTSCRGGAPRPARIAHEKLDLPAHLHQRVERLARSAARMRSRDPAKRQASPRRIVRRRRTRYGSFDQRVFGRNAQDGVGEQGLARARRPDDGHDFARMHADAQRMDRLHRAARRRNPRKESRPRSGSSSYIENDTAQAVDLQQMMPACMMRVARMRMVVVRMPVVMHVAMRLVLGRAADAAGRRHISGGRLRGGGFFGRAGGFGRLFRLAIDERPVFLSKSTSRLPTPARSRNRSGGEDPAPPCRTTSPMPTKRHAGKHRQPPHAGRKIAHRFGQDDADRRRFGRKAEPRRNVTDASCSTAWGNSRIAPTMNWGSTCGSTCRIAIRKARAARVCGRARHTVRFCICSTSARTTRARLGQCVSAMPTTTPKKPLPTA